MKARPYDAVKRVLDVLSASFGLIVLSPVLAVTAALVAVKLGRPVLFRQPRAGLDGRPFTLVKFRSMRDIDEAKGLVTDAQRLTPFGRRLRSTSLDELPELLNVLRGEMSIVGPRPLHVYYLERYTPHQARRHEVRPGITGLAQVSGRNGLPWEDRLRIDVEYVDSRSLGLDLRILWRTVATVLRRSGVSASDSATMKEFLGTDGREWTPNQNKGDFSQ